MVDTSQADGGLGAVLTESRVAQPLVETITTVVGCSTLEDFLGCVTEKGWEIELQSVFMDKCTDAAVKTNPLQLARLRQAYKIGIAARQRSTAVATESEADIEKPLEANDTVELRKLWTLSYPHVSYDEYLTPADNVVARVYREFRRKSHSLTPINRVRSIAFDRRPIVKARREIAEGVVIETDSRKEVHIRSYDEYIWGLKILAVCWTLVGNFKTKSSRGDKKTDVLYCSHTEAFGYADRVLRKAMQNAPTRDALSWVRDRDEATRATAVMKARSDIPFGEALHDAWMEHRSEWNTAGGRTSEREMEEDSPPSKRSRKRSSHEEHETPRKRAGKGDKTVSTKQLFGSTLPGNRHVCKAWVNGMCTKKESECPQKRAHVCDVILSSGKICGGSHRRAAHPAE